MLTRRAFLGRLTATLPLPLVAMPGTGRAQGARPRLHGLVVGINTYTGNDARGRIRPLRGCLNDADDIEAQVRRLEPASFRRLGWDPARRAEQAVTRADFFAAWRAMLADARTRDTVLLTFSGHGSQVPVLPGNPSQEVDELDETLVLTGFDVRDGRNAEHIIDDELDELVRAAHAKGVIVVLVSDSCHSGTVYRRVELGGVSYRTINPGPAVRGNPVAPPRPTVPPEAPPNLLFLAGSQENELVPEIAVNGRYRGALSVALARGLEGRAAADGVITAYGLARFVLGHVRDLSDGGQHPNVTWPSPDPAPQVSPTKATPTGVLGVSRNTPLIVLAEGPAPVEAPVADIGPVLLRIIGLDPAERQRIVASLNNAVLVEEGEPASLIWDASQKLVLNDQGHMIAEQVDASLLQHAVDRRLALERLIRMSADNRLDVKILVGGRESPASDATYRPGRSFGVAIGGVDAGHYYALFNLTGNGQVELLEPHPGNPPHFSHSRFGTGARRDTGGSDIHVGGVVVKPQGPFGAEHVVAVAGALPLSRLMPALAKAHDTFATPHVMAGLTSEAEVQPLQVGFRGIYSARE